MDLKEVKQQIKELIALMQGTQVSELEVERKGVRIKIRKDQATSERGLVAPQVQVTQSQEPVVHEPATKSRPPGGGDEAEREDYILIRSPIVGTFYRAPSPGAEPYVEAGETIKKGQILCVVEAMKLMNEIESEADGKILEVLAENAQPVEYGEPLFKIEALKEAMST